MFDILGLKSAGSYSEWSRIFRQEVPIAITVIKVGISLYLSVEIVKKFLFLSTLNIRGLIPGRDTKNSVVDFYGTHTLPREDQELLL